jgi:hypothetical protein
MDQATHHRIKDALQSMDDYEFEHLVADLWGEMGWQTQVETQSMDAGVDVRAVKSVPYEQKVLIQAKRYSGSNKVGGPDIQQYSALKNQEENVDKVVVVTTGEFTRSARRRANDLNVKLVDGDDLVDLLVEYDTDEIAREYLVDETEEPEPARGATVTMEVDTERYTDDTSTDLPETDRWPFSMSALYTPGFVLVVITTLAVWIMAATAPLESEPFWGEYPVYNIAFVVMGLAGAVGVYLDGVKREIGLWKWIFVLAAAFPLLLAFSGPIYILGIAYHLQKQS